MAFCDYFHPPAELMVASGLESSEISGRDNERISNNRTVSLEEIYKSCTHKLTLRVS